MPRASVCLLEIAEETELGAGAAETNEVERSNAGRKVVKEKNMVGEVRGVGRGRVGWREWRECRKKGLESDGRCWTAESDVLDALVPLGAGAGDAAVVRHSCRRWDRVGIAAKGGGTGLRPSIKWM